MECEWQRHNIGWPFWTHIPLAPPPHSPWPFWPPLPVCQWCSCGGWCQYRPSAAHKHKNKHITTTSAPTSAECRVSIITLCDCHMESKSTGHARYVRVTWSQNLLGMFSIRESHIWVKIHWACSVRESHIESKSTGHAQYGPTLTASAMAMADSVTVSMGLLMKGVLIVSCLVRADVRSYEQTSKLTVEPLNVDTTKSGHLV